jgi:adenylate kinase family enzyme
MVLGVSAGVGKSTFARRLGEALNIKVYHLDALYWKAGWVEAYVEEFAAAQREIVSRDEWIIEGNYSNTYEIRAERADTMIYLELPLPVCLYRVLKRWLTNLGKTRPDMAEGCKEKMDWDFIKFICKTYYPRKRKMDERFRRFQLTDPDRTVVILKNRQEIQSFLDNIQRSREHEGVSV